MIKKILNKLLLFNPFRPRQQNRDKISETTKSGERFDFSYDKDTEVPWHQPMPGIYRLLPIAFDMPGYVHRTNCFVIGDAGEPAVIIDPSPKDDGEYRKFFHTLHTLKKTGIAFREIFITHHHVDHHQQAPRLARELSLPIALSEYTFRQLKKRAGETYLAGIDIKIVREGDVMANWQGKPVKVYEIPGHDEGQLALAPDSMEGMEWFLVGDLIQTQGTVVIGTEEGDMIKYYESLERVIQLNPQVLLPSHGLPLESTKHAADTLKHRKIREKQILHYHRKGHTPEQMVKILYKGVDRRLWPLALENIKSHLKKLEKEQAF